MHRRFQACVQAVLRPPGRARLQQGACGEAHPAPKPAPTSLWLAPGLCTSVSSATICATPSWVGWGAAAIFALSLGRARRCRPSLACRRYRGQLGDHRIDRSGPEFCKLANHAGSGTQPQGQKTPFGLCSTPLPRSWAFAGGVGICRLRPRSASPNPSPRTPPHDPQRPQQLVMATLAAGQGAPAAQANGEAHLSAAQRKKLKAKQRKAEKKAERCGSLLGRMRAAPGPAPGGCRRRRLPPPPLVARWPLPCGQQLTDRSHCSQRGTGGGAGRRAAAAG